MGEGTDEAAIAALLHRLREGEEQASGELFSLMYAELRALASSLFRSQRASHTLQPTAVVHEAFMKMVKAPTPWEDRAHFFAVAARAMRQILVNHARDRSALKRGGGFAGERVTLSEAADGAPGRELDVLAAHEALEELAQLDERQARIAELRFFAGLNNPEVAEVLGLGLRTVELDWKMAKDWLAKRLGSS
ncbi:MAG: ECF-type sigma factor [Planctomycetota bacterium]|jgi:RNA polymerase sigma factor (TIGR02999 family)